MDKYEREMMKQDAEKLKRYTDADTDTVPPLEATESDTDSASVMPEEVEGSSSSEDEARESQPIDVLPIGDLVWVTECSSGSACKRKRGAIEDNSLVRERGYYTVNFVSGTLDVYTN